VNPLPGSSAVRSYTPRNIYASMELGNPGFDRGTIDATYAIDGGNTGYTQELRPGTIMARLTTSLLWVPCKRTRVNGAVSSSEALVVDDARAFKVGDEVTVGSTTGLIIEAINYSTNQITFTVDTVDAANDAIVIGSGSALAGSELARGILDEFVDLYDPHTRANVDRQVGRIVTSNAKILTTMVLGDLTSVLAATDMLNHIQFYTNGVQV
jgi:hypothetical protein